MRKIREFKPGELVRCVQRVRLGATPYHNNTTSHPLASALAPGHRMGKLEVDCVVIKVEMKLRSRRIPTYKGGIVDFGPKTDTIEQKLTLARIEECGEISIARVWAKWNYKFVRMLTPEEMLVFDNDKVRALGLSVVEEGNEESS